MSSDYTVHVYQVDKQVRNIIFISLVEELKLVEHPRPICYKNQFRHLTELILGLCLLFLEYVAIPTLQFCMVGERLYTTVAV